jgi:preprotein translocase subunit SecF
MADAAKHERADFKRLRALFKKAGIKVQNVLQPGRKEDNRYEVILGGLGEDIKKAFGAGVVKDIPQVESVGAKMGQQLRDDGIKSVLYALLLMLIYIAFRFDFRYAPGAVVALAHDVIITTGLFAVTWAEFTLPVVAALLTIAGYSINDTIVVFDRIRENVARLRDRKFPLVVNSSINETLSRTLLTSLTTLFTCASIWIVGTGVLKTFAFALTAGVVIGTYSSVLIASPLVVVLNERFARRAKR